jgi:hypothetical protein
VKTPYPHYNVLDKWTSPSFDTTTRNVLAGRMHAIPERRFLTDDEWQLLEAITTRLIPQPDRMEPVPITPWIDDLLFADRREGFRHDNMPPLRVAWRAGLAAIDGEAQRRHAHRFVELETGSQDVVLQVIQQDDVDRTLWNEIPAQRFFTDILLKTVAGIYYAHPAAWSEIGFGGPASPRGYVRLGFGERDPWEAREAR